MGWCAATRRALAPRAVDSSRAWGKAKARFYRCAAPEVKNFPAVA